MMNTITCPRCNTENPTDAMNCRQCRTNLEFALEHPEEIEATEQQETKPPRPALQEQYPSLQPTKTNVLAIVSIVSGLLALYLLSFSDIPIVHAVPGTVAFITGLFARIQIRESEGTKGGVTMATAGVIIGAISFAMVYIWLFSIVGQ